MHPGMRICAWLSIGIGLVGLVTMVCGNDRGEQDRLLMGSVDKVYGDVLLHDKQTGTVVAVKRANGNVVSVQIDSYKRGINLKLEFRDQEKPPQVTYARSNDGLGPTPRVAWWVDLDADGVFDRRTTVGDWPLLDGELGPRAYVSGKWVPMRKAARVPGDDGPEGNPMIEIEGKPYHFDFASGKWIAGAQ